MNLPLSSIVYLGKLSSQFMKKTIIIAAMSALISISAIAADKLKGVNNVEFGWKIERCREALPNVGLQQITDNGDNIAYAYHPAVWGRIDWDTCVLDFFKDKLYQIGFVKASATDDRTSFSQAKVILTAAYGQPRELNNSANSYIWSSSNGNLIVLQYSNNPSTPDTQYSTYLYFVDNKEVTRKAKKAERELRDLMK